MHAVPLIAIPFMLGGSCSVVVRPGRIFPDGPYPGTLAELVARPLMETGHSVSITGCSEQARI